MSGAFDPTPLRPDASAMPVLAHTDNTWNEQVPYQPGLTARQHAAIALCVPDSGTDWLDAMIEQRRRDEFAAKALQALISNAPPTYQFGTNNPQLNGAYSTASFAVADAMLAASKQ